MNSAKSVRSSNSAALTKFQTKNDTLQLEEVGKCENV